MPNETQQPDDNLSPLEDEINWEIRYPTIDAQAIASEIKAKWIEWYRNDPVTAIRAVDVVLSSFKAYEEEDEAQKTPAMKTGEMEAARILGNWGYYDPPIYEEEIKAYAQRFKISEREAEEHLRRRRAYDS